MPSILLNSTQISTEKLLPMVEATTKVAAAVMPITKTTTTIMTSLSVHSHGQNKRPTIIIYPTGAYNNIDDVFICNWFSSLLFCFLIRSSSFIILLLNNENFTCHSFPLTLHSIVTYRNGEVDEKHSHLIFRSTEFFDKQWSEKVNVYKSER